MVINLSKVYFTQTSATEGLTKRLLGDGKVLSFDFNGSFLKEESFNFDSNLTLQEIDLLSLLVYGKHFEVATSCNGVFQKRPFAMTLPTFLRFLNGLPGLLFIGHRKGVCVGVEYLQSFYAFLPHKLDVLDTRRDLA